MTVTMNTEYIVKRCIEDSVRHGGKPIEIEAKVDSQEWVELVRALRPLATECFEERRRVGSQRLYWGTDADGDEWQVRLKGV